MLETIKTTMALLPAALYLPKDGATISSIPSSLKLLCPTPPSQQDSGVQHVHMNICLFIYTYENTKTETLQTGYLEGIIKPLLPLPEKCLGLEFSYNNGNAF